MNDVHTTVAGVRKRVSAHYNGHSRDEVSHEPHAFEEPQVRAALLVPVLLGLQRFLPEDGDRFPAPLSNRARAFRPADPARRRAVHRAVVLPVGARRRAGRPLRQGGDRAPAEARRVRRGGDRLRRVPARVAADPVRRAHPVRHAVGDVRAGEVRHPARPSLGARPAGRQRAGRGRDLHRHHRRHVHRRRGRELRRQGHLVRRADARLCRIELARGPGDPQHRARRPAPRRRQERSSLDLPPDARPARRRAALARRHHRQHVLAGRRRRVRPAAADGEDDARRQRARRLGLSRAVRDRHRPGLGPRLLAARRAHAHAADAAGGDPHRCRLARPRLRAARRRAAQPDGRCRHLLPRSQGMARRHRPRAAVDGRRPVRRALLRRRAGVGAGRPSRPHRRRRQRAVRAADGGRLARRRRAAGGRLVDDDGVRRARRRLVSRLGLDLQGAADEPAARFRGAGVPSRLSARRAGPRQYRQGGSQRDHRAEPREPARRRDCLLRSSTTTRSSRSTTSSRRNGG